MCIFPPEILLIIAKKDPFVFIKLRAASKGFRMLTENNEQFTMEQYKYQKCISKDIKEQHFNTYDSLHSDIVYLYGFPLFCYFYDSYQNKFINHIYDFHRNISYVFNGIYLHGDQNINVVLEELAKLNGYYYLEDFNIMKGFTIIKDYNKTPLLTNEEVNKHNGYTFYFKQSSNNLFLISHNNMWSFEKEYPFNSIRYFNKDGDYYEIFIEYLKTYYYINKTHNHVLKLKDEVHHEVIIDDNLYEEILHNIKYKKIKLFHNMVIVHKSNLLFMIDNKNKKIVWKNKKIKNKLIKCIKFKNNKQVKKLILDWDFNKTRKIYYKQIGNKKYKYLVKTYNNNIINSIFNFNFNGQKCGKFVIFNADNTIKECGFYINDVLQ